MRVSGRKDVREEAAILERLEFRYQGLDSAGHHVFHHPQHGEITLPGSPSSYQWRRDHRKAVAKAMGVNLTQVEALIHGQPVGKRRRTSGRKRTRQPAARHLHVAPELVAAPAAEPKPPKQYRPSDPISRARAKRWQALQSENLAARSHERLHNPFPWRAAA